MGILSKASTNGRRNYMEDRCVCLEENNTIVAMVCDGHGGYHSAEETITKLPRLLLDITDTNDNLTFSIKLRDVINNFANRLKNYKSGTTLTGVIIQEMDDGKKTVFIYNIGDSRTMFKLKSNSLSYMYKLNSFDNNGKLSVKPIVEAYQTDFFVTKDHDHTNENEKIRVYNEGGRLEGSDKRLNGVLSVTRAIGDADIGMGLSNIPDIYWTPLDNLNGPILMYSDGIYEPGRYFKNLNFEDKMLYTVATNFNCNVLVNYAFENNSEDNLTALLIDF